MPIQEISPVPLTTPLWRRFRSWSSGITLAAIFIILSGAGAFDANAQIQRVLGIDVSAWQANIAATNWNTLHRATNQQVAGVYGDARDFAFIRSSRGGTTGYYNQSNAGNNNPPGQNTFSQRYDDPYYVQNMNRSTTAGLFAGSYHFSRPDIMESTLNSGGIRNSGTNEAHHFIQMAGAFMRPGYLVPVHDLEAGISQRSYDELAQFAIDFSDFVYTNMQIRPAVYINGSYSAHVQNAAVSLRNQLAQPAALRPSVVSPAYPTLWVARWPNQGNPSAIDVQNTEPGDSISYVYGPWDDHGTTHPWQIWQYASTMRLNGYANGTANIDVNVARGGLEYLKDQLVPAIWWTDISGDWSTLANWNSGQAPVAPVTGTNQVSPIGTQTMPTPRLPGASGSGVTSGQHDTVILERPNSDITVTVSTGTHNIRKLYVRETLNITGGSLTVNFSPSSDSTTNGAQFSGPVTLSGGSLSIHTLQVDTNRTFTLAGGTLTLDKISLMPRNSTPAKILVSGDMNLNARSNALATIVKGAGSGATGYVDLDAGSRTLTVGDGTNEIDISIDVPVSNGALVKAGAGTLRVTSANTYSGGTTVSAGKLFVSNTSGSGTGTGAVTVDAGTLGGTGTISGVVTINSGGTVAPGTDSTIGTLTLSTTPTLSGTNFFKVNRNDGSPLADKLNRSGATLTFGGRLVVSNIGATLTGGETFTLFSATGYSGAFTATNLPTLSEGLNWVVSDLGTTGSINVNRSPVVSGATFTNVPTQVLQIAKASLIAGASDGDDDALTLVSFDAVTTNGITLTSDGTYIYYSNNANVADEFSYTVSDGRGGTATGVVQIVSNPSPLITDDPDSVTVIATGTATFSVTAMGTDPLGYQWKKNGGNVSGATSAALTLGNVSGTDAGSYTVVVTNAFGSATSAAATLTVHYVLNLSANGPGTISRDPDQASYAPGTEVTLTGTADTNAMFVSWSGDEVSFENPIIVTMTANKTVIGNFSGVGSVPDIIIDNDDLSATVTGNWQPGTSSTDKYGSNYYFASTVVGGTSNVTYTPFILTEGNYDVHIWYPQGSNRCTNSLWTVSYDGGSANVSVNQTNNGGKWVLITSARPFTFGSSGYVRVSNNSIQTGKVVMADAVKLVYSAIQGLAPIITNQPQSQIVLAGQNATFTVSAAGDPPGYQWQFNGTDIAGAITTSYTRSVCQSAHAGSYSVIVSNASGTATSASAILTVNTPASITTNPQGRTVVAGSNVVFTVSADGDVPLSYRWRFNGGNISGAVSSSYTVLNSQSIDAGSYSVVITNDYGTATSTDAVLVVNVPASISTPPQTQSVIQSSNVMFNVVASGTAPLSYQWRLNAVNISGATGSSYSRSNVQPGDAGSYSVVVTNIAGSATSANAVLTVNIPPSITTGPLAQSVIQSSNALFNVVATGSGILSYQWRFNGNPLPGATTSSYARANAQTNHVGDYSVIVTNAYGSVTSANALLSVIVPPTITTQPQTQSVAENDGVTFTVAAVGSPPINYQWRLNEVNILDATDSEYSLLTAQTGDAGTYSVVVSNAAGAVISSDAVLTVGLSAPIIVTHPTNVLTKAGLDVTFAVSATGQNLAYQWRYNGTGILDATASSYTLSNAQTNQSGSYSVIVSNSVGVVTSSSAILTVDGGLPTFKITGPLLNQRLLENAGATNYWTSVKGTALDNRPGVQVLYSTNMGVSFQAATGTTNWSAAIKIVPGTNRVVVKAVDQVGNSSLSVTQTFFYVVPSTLTLRTNGNGFITNPNGTALEVGKGYTITANVGTNYNYAFTNWTRVLNGATNHFSSSAALNFIMQSNLTLHANFISSPFVRAAGVYNGLFYNSNAVTHASSGSFTLTLSPKLTYTGKVQIDGDSVSISGKFDVSGTITTNIWRTNLLKSNLALSMGIDFTNWTDRITGTVSSTNWSATLIADRQVWSATNTAGTYTNKYTVLIPGFSNPAQAPTGSGYLLASVSALGKVTASGSVADGHLLSQGIAISKNGEWPLYVPLYKQKRIFTLGTKQVTNIEYQGSLMGWLTFATNTPAGKTNLAPQGRLSWIKEGWTNAVYPAGFAGSFVVKSSRHVPPPLGTRVLTLTDGTVTLSNGNLPWAFANNFTLGTDNKIVLATPIAHKLTLTLTKTTGALSGSFVHPQRTNPATKIFGAILQDYNFGRGYFIGTNQTGLFRLDD